ncbi:transposase [Nonomuraea sp. NPDC005730]|uniref:transposase n=1 Tax=Nonomuraea sp. NPDC005730 TaxID=3157055 RepID=UPI0033EC836B
MTRRHDLTDAQWAALEPHLPAASGRGRPPKWSRRLLIDGIRCSVRDSVRQGPGTGAGDARNPDSAQHRDGLGIVAPLPDGHHLGRHSAALLNARCVSRRRPRRRQDLGPAPRASPSGERRGRRELAVALLGDQRAAAGSGSACARDERAETTSSRSAS